MRFQNSGLSAREVMDAYLSEDPLSEDSEEGLTQNEGLTQEEGQARSAPTREEALAAVRPEERGRLQKAFGVIDRLIERAAYSITEEEFAASTVPEERIDRIQARLLAIRRREWLREAHKRWEDIQRVSAPVKNTALQDLPVPLKDPVGVLRQALALPPMTPAWAMARQRPAEMKKALQTVQERMASEQDALVKIAGGAADDAERLARQFGELAHSLRDIAGHSRGGYPSSFPDSLGDALQSRLQSVASQAARIASLEAEVAAQQALLEQQLSQESDPVWQADREAAARSAVGQIRLPEDGGAYPVNLEKIAEDLGLFVKQAPLDGFEGCLVTDGTVGGILIDAGMTDVRRQRFTLAHEVGHFLMHRSRGNFHDTAEDMSDYQSELELEANLFASLLLIPGVLLPSEAEGLAFADVDRIAAACDVSLLAAARRLIRHLDRACALVVLQNGQIRYYVGSRLFRAMGGHIRTKQAPHVGTAAAEFLADTGEGQVPAGGGEGQSSKQVPASLWVAGGPLAQEGRNLQEESRRLEDGFTYALLTLVDEEGKFSND